MTPAEGEVIKIGGGFIAAVLAFFSLKKVLSVELEKELNLRLELAHKEIEATNAEIARLKMENVRLEKLIMLRLVEKEHDLQCNMMQIELTGIKHCIEEGFMVLHKRLDKRRSTDDNKVK